MPSESTAFGSAPASRSFSVNECHPRPAATISADPLFGSVPDSSSRVTPSRSPSYAALVRASTKRIPLALSANTYLHIAIANSGDAIPEQLLAAAWNSRCLNHSRQNDTTVLIPGQHYDAKNVD